MAVSLPSGLLADYYTSSNTHYSVTPMATLTEAEQSDLPGMLEPPDDRIKAALLESARDMSRGVLSAWSYEDFQNEMPHPQIILSRSESVPVLPYTSSVDASSSPEPPEQELSARLRSISRPSAPNRAVPQDPAVVKRHRGRPRLGLSPETCAERRRAQLRKAQQGHRSRRDAAVAVLEQRNRNLKIVIDGMASSFLGLQGAALKVAESHLSVELAHQLQKGSDQFLELARAVYEGDGTP